LHHACSEGEQPSERFLADALCSNVFRKMMYRNVLQSRAKRETAAQLEKCPAAAGALHTWYSRKDNKNKSPFTFYKAQNLTLPLF
jgi:hypothetical protein